MHVFKVAVKELVGYSCRAGDLVTGFQAGPTAQQGAQAHRQLQKQRPEGYEAEVAVKHVLQRNQVELIISGRIDGLFLHHSPPILEEIKSTLRSPDTLSENTLTIHRAQAQIYAHILCQDRDLEECKIRMTYFQLDRQTEEHFEEHYTKEELKIFFEQVTSAYLDWLDQVVAYRVQRDQSIKSLEFPYGSYRPGQRPLAVQVYRTVVNEQQLLSQAPTGIGKTMSTLFPAVKAIGEGQHDTIFYLTAKTIGRTMAEDAINDMAQQGLFLKTITFTAKDKLCYCRNGSLEPTDDSPCPYAVGYFDRLNEALHDAFQRNQFTRSEIEALAQQHRVCPFEFSLELAHWVDVIIADYNYVFHPTAGWSGFHEDRKRRKTLLIDEAHNLLERARDMFSETLSKQRVLTLSRVVKASQPAIASSLKSINRDLLNLKKSVDDPESGFEKRNHDCFVRHSKPNLFGALQDFCEAMEPWLATAPPSEFKEELLEFYFDVLRFLRIYELYDEHYVTLMKFVTWGKKEDVQISLYCLDPSALLNESLDLAHSAILFSATLAPFPYYARTLGLSDDHHQLALPSPFPPQHLGLFIASHVKTTYAKRADFYDEVAALIATVVQSRNGNYLVCFPSYQYLQQVKNRVVDQELPSEIVEQSPQMTEEARVEFLHHFTKSNASESRLGFAIMGGLFGEGIDLPGEQLIGVIVVSVGLPQLCPERDLIRDHFNQNQAPGFEFAYQYPGMNRVLQTAGRVIRSECDKGIVVLIDERFTHSRYRNLFPQHWHSTNIRSCKALENELGKFWAAQTSIHVSETD